MPQTPKAPRGAGRPARLSRQRILDTGLAMLREGAGTDFSIRQLARRLETVPGSLYTYFTNKEALLDALADFALDPLEIPLDTTLAWDQQVACWMEQFHQALKTRPELMLLIGLAGTSPSTLRKVQHIARLLQEAGLEEGEAVLQTQSLLWTVMSFTLFEVQAGNPEAVQQLREAGDHGEYRDVMRHMALEDLTPLWAATLQRNLDGLRLRVAQYRAGSLTTPPPRA